MKTRKLVAVACAIALVGAPAAMPQALAGTATVNMSVSTSVAGTCTVAATPMGFAPYTGTVDNTSATITVTCSVSAGLSPFVTVNTNASGQRNLINGPSTLAYTLCEDAACATPLTSTTHFPVGFSTGGTATTVFGQIPAGESGLTGSYNDSAVITLNF